MPYKYPARDSKPWRLRRRGQKPRGWVFLRRRTITQLERRAKKLGLSRHEYADRLVRAILAAVGA